MDSHSGSEPRKFLSFRLGKENKDQPQQTPVETEMSTVPEQSETGGAYQPITPNEMDDQREPMDEGFPQHQSSPNLSLVSRLFATDSSGSNGSCGTYITCKMSQLEEAAAEEFTEMTELAQRESISEPLTIIPSVQQYE